MQKQYIIWVYGMVLTLVSKTGDRLALTDHLQSPPQVIDSVQR